MRAVLQNQEGKFLLLKRSARTDIAPDKWEFAGGKIDPGENFVAALIREVKEETGFDVEPVKILGASEWEKKNLITVYLYTQVKIVAGIFQLSPEHQDFKWVMMSEIPSLDLAPQMMEFVKSDLKKVI